MKFTLALVSTLLGAAVAAPAATTSAASSTCASTYSGEFEITVVVVSTESKRSLGHIEVRVKIWSAS
jgi:hypothetical protein